MTLEILYFTMYLLSSVFIILSLIFLIKYKQFQPDQLSKSTDVYLFGLVFLFLYTFIIFLDSGKFILRCLCKLFNDNFKFDIYSVNEHLLFNSCFNNEGN